MHNYVFRNNKVIPMTATYLAVKKETCNVLKICFLVESQFMQHNASLRPLNQIKHPVSPPKATHTCIQNGRKFWPDATYCPAAHAHLSVRARSLTCPTVGCTVHTLDLKRWGGNTCTITFKRILDIFNLWKRS